MDTGDTRRKDLVERARALLANDGSQQVRKNLDGKLEALAADLLLEWLVGDRRFESQSQQTEYWLSRFYEEIFVDEQPDTTRIYERFAFSLPRASYMARLLRARRTAQWRNAARLELTGQLERYRAPAEESRKDGTAHIQEFDISLSTGAGDELRVQFDRYCASVAPQDRPRPPKSKPSLGNTRWFGVPAETLLLLLDFIKKGDAI